MRLSEIITPYLNYQQSYNKQRSVQNAGLCTRIILNHFGDREVSLLTESDLTDFIEKRRQTVKDVSINGNLTILRGLLRFAHERGLIEKIPFRIRMLRVDKKKDIPVLSKQQLRTLVEASSGPYRGMLLLAVCSGMRTGEILHLQWKNLDVENGSVRITAKEGWSPKSHQSRSLFISEEAISWLLKYRESSLFNRPADFIFAARTGKPLIIQVAIRKIRAIFESVGFYEKGRPLLHWIRHSVCSTLLANGADIETTREIMGHASWETTQRYAHTTQDQMKKASALLEL